ncbi:hypothetical protein [Ruminococcus flavefaciens]|uniref:hypothetical protein n=1 Tax=Ruminococcus flavefaciens TaxID=1265 RepID=UPI000467AB49|nr:hypothetical protein [Ruminococcus flavefaciens]
MNDEKQTFVCSECGKLFEWERKGKGRLPHYCSAKCKNKRDNRATVAYLKQRYRDDLVFRERRKRSNILSMKRKRDERKAQAMEKLVNDLLAATTVEQVREILNERVRLKSELYMPQDSSDNEEEYGE